MSAEDFWSIRDQRIDVQKYKKLLPFLKHFSQRNLSIQQGLLFAGRVYHKQYIYFRMSRYTLEERTYLGCPEETPRVGAPPAYRVARPMAIDILIGYSPPTLAQTAEIASSTPQQSADHTLRILITRRRNDFVSVRLPRTVLATVAFYRCNQSLIVSSLWRGIRLLELPEANRVL